MSHSSVQRRSSRPLGRARGFLAASIFLLSCLSGLRAAEASYGHIRTVVGEANLLSGGSPEAIEATANYPVQVGDRIVVAPGGRLEVILADGNRVRFDGNSELTFERLAQPANSRDDGNLLQLLQGEIQISLTSEPLSKDGFRIDTANASLWLLSTGSYRIFTDGRSWTEVTVRRGFVELATERGTQNLAPNQQALIDGERSPRVSVQSAPAPDGLERWADSLEAEPRSVEAQMPYRRGLLPRSLGYAAAPLQRHGRWMRYRGCDVWRPHVSIGWRPYHSGWWIYTPAGMTWVSTEPWGWVPYHFGYWGFAGGIGWVWYPGHHYTPGAVYWYWGPTHVGWIPVGYYWDPWGSAIFAMPPFGHFPGHFTHRAHPGGHPRVDPFRIKGHVPDDIAHWRDWTFSPYDRFGFRDSHRHLRTGADLQRRGVFSRQIPEGVVTTETGSLTPNLWGNPRRLLAALETTRPLRPQNDRWSRLGAAALSGSSSPAWPSQPDDLARSPRSQRLDRQWDPDRWRRDRLSGTRPVEPYRRDTRGSFSSRRGSPDGVSGQRPWYSRPDSGTSSSRSRPHGSRLWRPTTPGPDRSFYGTPRSPVTRPGSGPSLGRPSAPAGMGRARPGAVGPGTVSGRGGRSMSASPPRSPGGDRGSG